jgi:hypothetical protein
MRNPILVFVILFVISAISFSQCRAEIHKDHPVVSALLEMYSDDQRWDYWGRAQREKLEKIAGSIQIRTNPEARDILWNIFRHRIQRIDGTLYEHLDTVAGGVLWLAKKDSRVPGELVFERGRNRHFRKDKNVGNPNDFIFLTELIGDKIIMMPYDKCSFPTSLQEVTIDQVNCAYAWYQTHQDPKVLKKLKEIASIKAATPMKEDPFLLAKDRVHAIEECN